MYVSLIGAPCSGKGTHAHNLKTEKHFHAIGAGDTLREYITETNDAMIQNLIHAGKIVPADLVWRLMRSKMEKLNRHGSARILLDGFPRDISQAQYLCDFLKNQSAPVYFIEFIVNDDKLIERMTARYMCNNCGHINSQNIKCTQCNTSDLSRRTDDNTEIFQQRLDIYKNNLAILKDYLCTEQHTWIEIDAERDINTIKNDIYNAISV